MSTPQEAALHEVSQSIADKVERAFWELDDVMVALAPDAPVHVAQAWAVLHSSMTPEFIAKRDRLRGLLPTVAG